MELQRLVLEFSGASQGVTDIVQKLEMKALAAKAHRSQV